MKTIELEEIRVGNYTQSNNGWVHDIDPDDYMNISVNGSNGYNAIPLNGEWLLKFGFADYGEGIYYTEIQNNGMRFYVNMDNNCIRLSMDNNFYSSAQLPVRVFYVHQLQNLFFALTGTELTISER